MCELITDNLTFSRGVVWLHKQGRSVSCSTRGLCWYPVVLVCAHGSKQTMGIIFSGKKLFIESRPLARTLVTLADCWIACNLVIFPSFLFFFLRVASNVSSKSIFEQAQSQTRGKRWRVRPNHTLDDANLLLLSPRGSTVPMLHARLVYV